MTKKSSKKSNSKTIVIIKKDKPKPKKDYEVGFKKPPKHTQFKKGVCSNPLGPNANAEKRALRELTTLGIKDAIEKTMTCTVEELEALVNDPETTVGHKIIMRAALDASEDGDYSKFDFMLERVVGKVPIKTMDLTNMAQKVKEQLENKKLVQQAIDEVEGSV